MLSDLVSLFRLATNRYVKNVTNLITFIYFNKNGYSMSILWIEMLRNLLVKEGKNILWASVSPIPTPINVESGKWSLPSRYTAECYNMAGVPLITIPYTYFYRCGFTDTVQQVQTFVDLCTALCLHGDCLHGECLYEDKWRNVCTFQAPLLL